jgi:hypothetical protein
LLVKLAKHSGRTEEETNQIIKEFYDMKKFTGLALIALITMHISLHTIPYPLRLIAGCAGMGGIITWVCADDEASDKETTDKVITGAALGALAGAAIVAVQQEETEEQRLKTLFNNAQQEHNRATFYLNFLPATVRFSDCQACDASLLLARRFYERLATHKITLVTECRRLVTNTHLTHTERESYRDRFENLHTTVCATLERYDRHISKLRATRDILANSMSNPLPSSSTSYDPHARLRVGVRVVR